MAQMLIGAITAWGALFWCMCVCEATAGLQHVLSENAPVKQAPLLPKPQDRPSHQDLRPLEFDPLPLGSVRARGWLQDQLELMAAGLPGHEHDFYRIVKDNPWLGGDQDYSILNEAFPYWFNGLVPLAYLTEDERLKEQVLSTADYVLSHQQEDGWLGPETNLSTRNFWARYLMLTGFIQLADVEAGTDLQTRILDSIHRFINLMHSMLLDNYRGYVKHDGEVVDDQWGRSRAADIIMSLQWVYEHDPRDQKHKLLDCMYMFEAKGMNWTNWFTEGVYLKQDLDTVPDTITTAYFPFEHGVNAAQGLKAAAVLRRYIHDDRLLETSRRGVNWTFRYHGTPSGVIIADERLAGLSPVRGVELCTVVETMFSLNYLYQTLGDNSLADQCELAAYNALPVMTLPDWWAHQYVAQTNQPISHHLSKTPFFNVYEEGQRFGLEPDYPCCTVNHPQGYPKFVAAAFLRRGENSIAHALLGPMSVTTTTRSGTNVSIVCNTNYPFAHDLQYTTSATHPFTFLIRLPTWSTSTTIILNPSPHTGMQEIPLEPGTSHIHVTFTTDIRVDPRANDTVSIYHGALLYAIPITYNLTSQRVPGYETAPPNVLNHDLLPTSPWAYAIDPTTLRFRSMANGTEKLPNLLWTLGAPTSITATVCEIDWPMVDGYAANPPLKEDRRCVGKPFEIDLVPYGSAKLHMAELPVMRLGV
ncbi:hypothetical protein BO71DRAFT_413224 [Aspergillus ellipticus CBS 707.79]|uniref:DUF1680-domain-containing protein n=1 Tax=Aspergillus ellipticus CBS 707.79 TaxID=1448320 RepID=A0A319CWF4_9EURO|nr:hypothetical protein BO71DRAFT_413224 [Aspergillus ellipticus CBS 707.79]